MIINCINKKFDFEIAAPPSKSIYHRELIVRFLRGDHSHLSILEHDSDDVCATKSILTTFYNLTKDFNENPDSDKNSCNYSDDEKCKIDENMYLHVFCNESGSTLRFMIPVAAGFLLGAGRNHYGIKGIVFETRGRLFDRPLKELEDAMRPHGIVIEKDAASRSFVVTGEMTPGEYTIDGSVSSQYITGLLMALTIFDEPCKLIVTGEIKSIHYIELALLVLEKYGCPVKNTDNIYYPYAGGYNQPDKPLSEFHIEGDWSNGAFLLCMKKWTDIKVTNLNEKSAQGDKAIVDFLNMLRDVESGAYTSKDIFWDCTDIPDITPYMAITAAFVLHKITFTGISRLRIKESDRVMAVRKQLSKIGVKTVETEDSLTVYGYEKTDSEATSDISTENDKEAGPIQLSSYNDHRMAMTAILIAVILKTRIELDNINCIRKSFPEFLEYINKYFL